MMKRLGLESPALNSMKEQLDEIPKQLKAQKEAKESGAEASLASTVTTANETKLVTNGKGILDPMPIISAADSNLEQLSFTGDLTRSDILQATYRNIDKYNKSSRSNASEKSLNNKYIGETRIPRDGLRHPFNRMRNTPSVRNTVSATVNLPLYFENAVPVNEAEPGRNGANKAYILLGAYKDSNNKTVIVRIAVNAYTKEIEEVKSLYALNAKKEDGATNAASVQDRLSSSSISIAKLLEIASNHFPNELSKSVADKLMYNEIGRYGVNVREAFMANNNTEVTFEIMEHIGVIDARKDGWNKEVNIVAWNGGQPLPTDIAAEGILISPLP